MLRCQSLPERLTSRAPNFLSKTMTFSRGEPIVSKNPFLFAGSKYLLDAQASPDAGRI